jgi:hypothetical protein
MKSATVRASIDGKVASRRLSGLVALEPDPGLTLLARQIGKCRGSNTGIAALFAAQERGLRGVASAIQQSEDVDPAGLEQQRDRASIAFVVEAFWRRASGSCGRFGSHHSPETKLT